MPRQELLIQLITDGRPAWQVRAEVSKRLCRKMTNDELGRLGTSTINELAAIIEDVPPAPEKKPEADRKKKGG